MIASKVRKIWISQAGVCNQWKLSSTYFHRNGRGRGTSRRRTLSKRRIVPPVLAMRGFSSISPLVRFYIKETRQHQYLALFSVSLLGAFFKNT